MKRFFSSAISLMLLFVLLFNLSCAGIPQHQSNGPVPPQQIQRQAPASPYYTGNGGKGMSIAILPPQATGLAENQRYLPALVQGEFVSNFSGFSAISVLDRQRLDDQYRELESGYYDINAEVGRDFGKLTPTTHIMGGNITRTATGYALQIQITKTADKKIAASHSKTFTFVELDNLTGVRRASLDLLQKMGVTLTAQAQRELAGAAAGNSVMAQTALAQGITAQRQGAEVTAMFYANAAALYDPSLLEAVSRSSILTASISSGSLGDNIRNDIRWRDEWVARLRETEQVFNNFFDNYFKTVPQMPYTLFYYGDVKQIGETNYQARTATLSGITTNLHASQDWALLLAEPPLQAAQKAVQAVYDGLNATGRKTAWGLGNWPQQGAFNRSLFRRQTKNFTIIIELVNSRNQVIGRETFQTGGSYEFPVPLPGNATRIQISADERKTVNFNNVKADDITDSLTVRIASVNGIPAETAARNGVLQIPKITWYEFDNSGRFRFSRGEIQGFANNAAKTAQLGIPDTIWDERVTAIADGAFRDAGLTDVSIPEGVTSIGDRAFAGNRLTSVIIPEGVITIGDRAFSNNQWMTNEPLQYHGLHSITIANSVTSIGQEAFATTWTTTAGSSAFWRADGQVTIGANVRIGNNAFGGGFEEFYANRGLQAGTYYKVPLKGELVVEWTRLDNMGVIDPIDAKRNRSNWFGLLFWALLIGGLVTYAGLHPELYDKGE